MKVSDVPARCVHAHDRLAAVAATAVQRCSNDDVEDHDNGQP